MTKDKLLEIIIKSVPYPSQIFNVDSGSEDTAIRFSWRSSRFRVSDSLGVETVRDCFLEGSDISILMESLLKRTACDIAIKERVDAL